MKPFVIARKNFLFANTPKGALVSAVLFSIIQTAKENGLDPYKYLTYIFTNAPNMDIENHPGDIDKLMPYAQDVIANCKSLAPSKEEKPVA